MLSSQVWFVNITVPRSSATATQKPSFFVFCTTTLLGHDIAGRVTGMQQTEPTHPILETPIVDPLLFGKTPIEPVYELSIDDWVDVQSVGYWLIRWPYSIQLSPGQTVKCEYEGITFTARTIPDSFGTRRRYLLLAAQSNPELDALPLPDV